MNLIYIATIRIPTDKAHGLQIMKMCESFSAAGLGVKLVVPFRKNDLGAFDPFDYYRVKRSFKITTIPALDPRLLLAIKAGLYIKFQAFCFMASLFFYLLISDKKDTVIYTRDEFLLPLIQVFSPNVFWEGHALPRNINRYLKYLKRCRGVAVLTDQVRKELIQRGLAEAKIMVAPDAVDLKIFDIDISKNEARKELQLPLNRTILGYTGTFKTKGMDKGLADIFKALRIIGERGELFFIAIGGSAEDIEFYQNLAAENGVKDRVLLLAKVPQDKLAVFQKAFDVLLMPFPFNRHYAYYMSPLKMFEYMAANRPIITSDLPSVREILSEDNCLFCQPDNPADLAEKINTLIKDPDLAEKISRNSYADVKKYTWEKRAENILIFLKFSENS